MEKIMLMTDSASDISYQNEKRYHILIVPIKLSVGGRSYESRIDFDNEGFYKMLDEYDEIPLTSQVTPYEFSVLFEEQYKNGYTDVINVSMNSTGSATHANAVTAAQEFFERHPEAPDTFRIYNIDSGTYTGCFGYAVVEAAKMIEKGVPAREIVSYIADWCSNVAGCFALYTLKYAAKSGRIPSIAAHMGNALGVKPIMLLYDHKIETVGKVRGEKNIIPEIVERAVADMETGAPYCVIYGSDPSVRGETADLLTGRLGYPPADIYQIGAAIAANCGPKIVGIVYRKKKS